MLTEAEEEEDLTDEEVLPLLKSQVYASPYLLQRALILTQERHVLTASHHRRFNHSLRQHHDLVHLSYTVSTLLLIVVITAIATGLISYRRRNLTNPLGGTEPATCCEHQRVS